MRFSTGCTLLALLIGLLLAVGHTAAQEPATDDCAAGRHFIIALPDTVANGFDSRFPPRHEESFMLFIYSATAQDVRISRMDGLSVSQPIGAGEVAEFDMERVSVPFVSRFNDPSTNALNVEADDPIIVYVYLSTHFGSAAFTPIPVERWGTEYVAATWPGEHVRNIVPAGEYNYDASRKVRAPGQIVILAAENNTRVTIEPTGSLANCVMCLTVVLQAGEAYQVQSFVDTNEGAVPSDLAGTRITATKPIGVLSGNTRSSIEPPTVPMLAGNTIKDLMAEWLRPTTSHGASFVVMPTMDELRPRPDADPVREAEYARIIPSYHEVTTIDVLGRDSSSMPQEINGSPVALGKVATDTMRAFVAAIAYATSGPAAVYQSPKPVVQFNGVTGGGTFTSTSYLSWGSFLVEATPREQWTSFAPFRAPAEPSAMYHYLNLVTDTASRFNVYYRQGTSARRQFSFNHGRIPGTDLVWGSMAIDPAVSYRLEGENGARFGGYVYGHRRGYELHRPGGTEEEKGGGSAAAHPSQYEEELAQYYAYPLASGYCALREADGPHADVTELGCGVTLVTIRVTGENTLGIGSVWLDMTVPLANTRLDFVTPVDSTRLSSERVTEVVVRLSPVYPGIPAKATLRFREKGTNGTGEISYVYSGTPLKPEPSGPITFDDMTRGMRSTVKSMTLRNTSGADLTVSDVDLAGGLNGFRIVRTTPEVDFANGASVTLADGETLVLVVDVTPMIDGGVLRDTIVVEHSCGTLTLAMNGTVEPSCIRLNDLDFGVLRPGEERSMALRICNDGPGRAVIPDSGEILSWIGSGFTVSATDLQRLRGTVLDSGECIALNVTFSTNDLLGLFRTTAKIASNSLGCRDTSIWIARVDTTTSGVDDPSSISGLALSPNPAGDALTVGFTLQRADDARVVLYDASGRVAASLDAGRLSAGAHRLSLDLSTLPSGVYLLRIGDLNERVIIVR